MRPCSSATRRTIDTPSPLPGRRLPGRAEEAIAQPRQHLGRQSGPVVLDDEHLRGQSHGHRGAGRRVAQRVVDQVAQQQGDQRVVAGERHRRRVVRGPLDRHLAAPGLDERQAVGQRILHRAAPIHHRGEVRRRAVVDAGQREQLRQHVREPVDARADLAERRLPRRIVAGDAHRFPLRAQRRQWRAQLVRGVGGQAALVLQRVPEAVEEAVRRLHQWCQLRGQSRDGHRMEFVGAARADVLGQPAHRPQRVPHHDGHRHEQHGQHQHPRQELTDEQSLEDFVALVGRLPDRDDPGAAGRVEVVDGPRLAVDRHRHESRRPCAERQQRAVAVRHLELPACGPRGDGHVLQLRTADPAFGRCRRARGRIGERTHRRGIERQHDAHHLLREPDLLVVEELVDLLARAPHAHRHRDRPDRGHGDEQQHEQPALQRHGPGSSSSTTPSA